MPTPTTVAIASLSIIALALLVATQMWKRQATFEVEANTERVDVAIGSERPGWRWLVEHASVFLDDDFAPVIFSGAIVVHPHTNCYLKRISIGPLKIRCKPDVDRPGAIADLIGPDESVQHTAMRRLVATVTDVDTLARDGRTLVLPMTGDVKLGSAITSDGADGLLRSGRVSRMEVPLLGPAMRPFEAGRMDLLAGDYLEFPPNTVVSGFATVDERPGISTVLRTITETATIRRFNAKGFSPSSTLAPRLLYDPFIQTLWAVGGIVFAFALKVHGWRRKESS